MFENPIRLIARPTVMALGTLALSTAALAQESDAYDRLVAAIASDTIEDLVFERDMEVSFGAGLRMDSELLADDKECPGLIDGLTQSVTPVLRESHEEGYARYRGQLEALFRKELSLSEATSAANFYETDLAQRLLATFIQQSTATNTLAEVMTDEAIESEETPDVSAEAIQADTRASARRMIKALPPKDVKAMMKTLTNAPWFTTFNGLQPQINALQLQMANEDFTPDQDARFNAAIEDFAGDHYAQCDALE